MTTMAAPRPASSISASWITAAAPASTPQVGCSTISTAGSRSISRPMTNFWRFPPDSAAAKGSSPSARTSNRSRTALSAPRVRPVAWWVR